MFTHVALGVLFFGFNFSPAWTQGKDKKEPPAKLTTAVIKSEKQLYRKTPQGDLYMHLFFPPGWLASDSRPAIVFFFGGGWKNGSYLQFVPQAEYFASRGMVAACAEYRIESKHKTTVDACVVDARMAVRWVRANCNKLGVSSLYIVAAGGSAGGHLAAMTCHGGGVFRDDEDMKAKESSHPSALVLFNPVFDLSKLTIPDAKGKDIAKAISVTPHRGEAPTILFYGTADKMLEQGIDYFTKSRAEKNHELYLYTAPDMPHGFFNRSPWLEVTTYKTDEFLAKLGYLRGPPTIKLPEGAKALNLWK